MKFLITICVLLFTFVVSAAEPAGYSNNSGVLFQGSVKYSVKPQKNVSKPNNAISPAYYQSTAGDRMYGWNGPVGPYSNAYHMGVDIWESPHYQNVNYVINDDYVTLPMPGILIGKATNDSTLGNALIFLHPSAGKNDADIYSMFLHNEASSIHSSLVVGAFYGAKQMLSGLNKLGYVTTIGKIGGTGSAGGINHLHYELRYFPQWIQSGYADVYASNSNDFQSRNNHYENPMSFSMNEVTIQGFTDEFSVNFALSLYYEQYSKLPQNSSECASLFTVATNNFNLPRSISTGVLTDYQYSWRNNQCVYQKVNNGGKYRISWGNSIRPRLATSISDTKLFTGTSTSTRMSMMSNFPIF